MLRVAIAQAEIAPSLTEGLARTQQLTRDAADAGATLIVFPETWLPGYPVWLDVCRDAGLWDHAAVKAVHGRMAANAVTVPGAAVKSLGGLAAETAVVLVVGIVERVDAGPGRGTLYNAILTFGCD